MESKLKPETIRKYIKGELEGEEKETFIQQLKDAPEDNRTVNYIRSVYLSAQHKEIFESFEEMDVFFENKKKVNDSRQQLNELLTAHKEENVSVVPINQRRRTVLRIAAALVILMLPLSLIFNHLNTANSPNIVAYNPTVLSSDFTPTSSDDLGIEYEKLIKIFNGKSYDEVISKVDSLLRIYPYDVEYSPYFKLMKGMSLYHLGAYGKETQAVIISATDNDSPEYSEHNLKCNYYLSMTYIKTEDYTKAKTVLEKIQSSASPKFIKEYQIKEWLGNIKELNRN